MQVEKIPVLVEKIRDEAKGESDSWFSRMRSELSTESSVNFHTKIILSPMKVSASIGSVETIYFPEIKLCISTIP